MVVYEAFIINGELYNPDFESLGVYLKRAQAVSDIEDHFTKQKNIILRKRLEGVDKGNVEQFWSRDMRLLVGYINRRYVRGSHKYKIVEKL